MLINTNCAQTCDLRDISLVILQLYTDYDKTLTLNIIREALLFQGVNKTVKQIGLYVNDDKKRVKIFHQLIENIKSLKSENLKFINDFEYLGSEKESSKRKSGVET